MEKETRLITLLKKSGITMSTYKDELKKWKSVKGIKSPRRMALFELTRTHPDIGFGTSWDWEDTVNLGRDSKSYLKSKGFKFIYEIEVPDAPKMKRGYPNTCTAWTKKPITAGDRKRIAAHIKKFMGY